MELNPLNSSSINLANDQGYLNKALEQQKEKAAAQDFEAVFIQSSLKQMRPKLEAGLFNDGLAVDVFYQFMDEAIAKEIARSPNNFGLADQLMQQNF